MKIELNKDIEGYRESVVMGFTGKQLVCSLMAVAVGGGIVLFLYPYIGLTMSVYVAVPAVSPIALEGFYTFNGMGFSEVMRRKIKMLFANKPLLYVSTEGEEVIRECRREAAAEKRKEEKKQKKKLLKGKGFK